MSEANPQNQNLRKPSFLGALEFGFLEIAFVTVVLILFFGTLNYFNILSLSKTFPQYFSWLPRQSIPVATKNNATQPQIATPTPIFNSNPLVNKAKSLGYNIILMDPNDTTGRTVFYEGKEIYNNEGTGIKTYSSNGITFIIQLIGSFQKFQDIEGSKDKYIQLIDPRTKQILPLVRINMNTSVASTTSGDIPTQLMVEDLKINSSDNPQNAVKSLGSIGNFKSKDLDKIIKSGDAIAIGIVVKNKKNPREENSALKAISLFIRRFGGKEQIDKELK